MSADSPKSGEVIADIAFSGAAHKLADKDAGASIPCRAALAAGWAIIGHYLPVLQGHDAGGVGHRVLGAAGTQPVGQVTRRETCKCKKNADSYGVQLTAASRAKDMPVLNGKGAV